MPLFEYTCDDCGITDEYIVYGNKKPICRHCENDNLVKIVGQGFHVGSPNSSEYEKSRERVRESSQKSREVIDNLPERWRAGNRIVVSHEDGSVSEGGFVSDNLGVVRLGKKRAGQNE